MAKSEDLSGSVINNWKALRKLDNRKYLYQCLLYNNIYEVNSYSLKSGKSRMCRECSNKKSSIHKLKPVNQVVNKNKQEILSLIQSFNEEIQLSIRINNLNIDIYIPNKKGRNSL